MAYTKEQRNAMRLDMESCIGVEVDDSNNLYVKNTNFGFFDEDNVFYVLMRPFFRLFNANKHYNDWRKTVTDKYKIEYDDIGINLESDEYLNVVMFVFHSVRNESNSIVPIVDSRPFEIWIKCYMGNNYFLEISLLELLKVLDSRDFLDAICMRREPRRAKEFELHEKFKRDIHLFLPDAKIVSNNNKNTDIPDFWVEKDGEKIPVEIKKDKINVKALLQAQRYMYVYKTKRAYVVAPQLVVELPENIEFIQLDFDK